MEVPFFDVDAMHIVWHGHYVKYLEMARCAFLSSIHYDYVEMGKRGYQWPVVQLSLKYVRPAHFGQKIFIDMAVVEMENCLRMDYVIADAASGTVLTRASTTQVVVDIATGQMQFQTPGCWQHALRTHPQFQDDGTGSGSVVAGSEHTPAGVQRKDS